MSDINEIKLSGTIHKLYRLKTKAGGPMTKVLLKVKQDTFWVLGYGNIASALMQVAEGDPLAISGTAQMNNWRTDDGDWKNDFNAVAWTAEIDGQEIRYQKDDTGNQEKPIRRESPNNQIQNRSDYDTIPNTPF